MSQLVLTKAKDGSLLLDGLSQKQRMNFKEDHEGVSSVKVGTKFVLKAPKEVMRKVLDELGEEVENFEKFFPKEEDSEEEQNSDEEEKGSDLTVRTFSKSFYLVLGNWKDHQDELKELGASKAQNREGMEGMRIPKEKLEELLEEFPGIENKIVTSARSQDISPPKKQEKTVSPKQKKSNIGNDLTYSHYSDKSFVVRGDTKDHKDKLAELGGKWNKNLQGGAGWIFSKNKMQNFMQTFSGATEVESSDKGKEKEKSGARKSLTYSVDFEVKKGDTILDEQKEYALQVVEVGDGWITAENDGENYTCWYVGGDFNGYILHTDNSYLLLNKKQ